MQVSLLSLGLAALVAVPSLAAQSTSCGLLTDINKISSGLSSNPSGARTGNGLTWTKGFVKCGKFWFFSADDCKNGRELWRTDGTVAGTVMVKDINPGAGGSNPNYLKCCDIQGRQVLYFQANNGKNGAELWRSVDGTAAGTQMVANIYPDTATVANSSFPSYLECLKGNVYFYARNATSDYELWCSNGTSAGTTRVKDIRPGTSGSFPRYLKLNSAGTEIYFRADDGTNGTELWKTNGTTAGTVLVKNIRASSSSSFPVYFVNHNGWTLFSASNGTNGTELWRTDGTAAGTIMVKDIRTGSSSSSPYLYYSECAKIGRDMIFRASTTANGTELWKTNGTTAGTVLVKDTRPGSLSGFPSYFHNLNATTVLFSTNDGTNGSELWKTDGTTAGTVLVKNIAAGSSSSTAPQLPRRWRSRLLQRLYLRRCGPRALPHQRHERWYGPSQRHLRRQREQQPELDDFARRHDDPLHGVHGHRGSRAVAQQRHAREHGPPQGPLPAQADAVVVPVEPDLLRRRHDVLLGQQRRQRHRAVGLDQDWWRHDAQGHPRGHLQQLSAKLHVLLDRPPDAVLLHCIVRRERHRALGQQRHAPRVPSWSRTSGPAR